MNLPFGGPPAAPGTVHLVGGGPGDPALLSLRAARLLSTATVIAYDRLAPRDGLLLAPPDCERIYVGKRPHQAALLQDDINALLVERARAGGAVVRYKGGDPFVFGRGGEEALACQAADVPFEVVPAVTSAIAAPAYAGIPVTHRGDAPAFAVVTGHEDPSKDAAQLDFAALAAFPGTLVLLMGVGRIRTIARALMDAGKAPATPVAMIRWGSRPEQEVLSGTLADIGQRVADTAFAPPAVTVVGAVAGLREQLGWFDRRPLHGVSVLVPRTRQQASALSERLRQLGAEPVEAPTIAIEPTTDPAALRAALQRCRQGHYDWAAFTSANGVDAVWQQLARLDADTRLLAGTRIAAVGPGTGAALAARGVRPDLVPDRYTTRGLGAALTASGAPGRILLPRADIATPTLTEVLEAAGWSVDEVEAYRTVPVGALPEGVRSRLLAEDIDVLAFASSSTVRNFVTLLQGVLPAATAVASIGPVTSATCRELGLPVTVEADPHDLDGLVDAVLAAAVRHAAVREGVVADR